MIFLIYVLASLFLMIVALSSVVFMLDSLFNGHDLSTSKRATKALASMIKRHKPDAKTFYDLGCARGALSLRLKKLLPRLEVCGIDNSATRIFFAKLKSIILRRNVNFKKQDIFETNFRDADIVYTYLWYDLMPMLEKKLQKELKQGALVITNTSRFQNWRPVEEAVTYPEVSRMPDFETLFVYIK